MCVEEKAPFCIKLKVVLKQTTQNKKKKKKKNDMGVRNQRARTFFLLSFYRVASRARLRGVAVVAYRRA